MYQFIETIKCVYGGFELLRMHLRRIEDTCLEHYGKQRNMDDIVTTLSDLETSERLHKVSLYYNFTAHEVKVEKYQLRKINNLMVVADNDIDYSLKYADRNILEKHKERAGTGNDCIILKNNKITDTSFSNLAFFNGKEWHTPTNPLLNGIKRKHLLQKKIIKERDIALPDLNRYQKVSLINSMLDIGEIELDINRIILLSN